VFDTSSQSKQKLGSKRRSKIDQVKRPGMKTFMICDLLMSLRKRYPNTKKRVFGEIRDVWIYDETLS